MALRPELAEIDRLFSDAQGTAEATLRGMTPAQLSWTPGGGRWSAAMIADHLVKCNAGVLEKGPEMLAAAPPADGETFSKLGAMERLFIGAMSPGSKIKFPVPPIFEPKPPVDPVAAVDAFFASHQRLVQMVQQANEKRIEDLKITSPASPLAKFRLRAYLHALAQHERYHLDQVKALIEEPGFPRN